MINVPKSTLSNWLSELPYTPNKVVLKRVGKAQLKTAQTQRQKKLHSIAEAKSLARQELRSVSRRDLMLLGIGLYIGEGEKNENVGIINSDPRVIKLAIRWLKEVYGLGTANFTIAIHLYPDNNIEKSLKFWSKTTGIPINQFGKTQVDRRKNKLQGKRGKLQYGTAHLRVKSNGQKEFGVLLSRRIDALMDRLLETRV